MSTSRKKIPYEFPRSQAVDRQENLRQVKMDVENLKEKLQKSILTIRSFRKNRPS